MAEIEKQKQEIHLKRKKNKKAKTSMTKELDTLEHFPSTRAKLLLTANPT